MSANEIKDLRSRYITARRELVQADADVSQSTALLADVDAARAAASRGDEPKSIKDTVEDLDAGIAGWHYDLAEIPKLDRPGFDDFDVEDLDDLRERQAELAKEAINGAPAKFEGLQSLLRAAVNGSEGKLADFSTLLEALADAVAAGDPDSTGGLARRFTERLDDRGIEVDDLRQFLEMARGPTGREHLAHLQTREGRTRTVAALIKSIEDTEADDYTAARAAIAGAIGTIESFAAARRAELANVTADLTDKYPTDAAKSLEGMANETPVLLLPTRLETRFEDSDDPNGPDVLLKVRIYPDDVHVDTHERELTDDEVRWGVHFWEQVWWANHAGSAQSIRDAVPDEILAEVDLGDFPDDPRARHGAVLERAWNQLAERFGAERATWVKRQVAPDAADELLDGPVDSNADDPDSVDFDALRADADRRPDTWTRAPRARGLPDQWIAFAETDGATVTARSNPVRRPLAVGPEPDRVGNLDGTDIDVDPGASGTDSNSPGDADLDALGDGETSWVFDFDEALDAGMALTIELTADQAAAGVDRLIVLGVSTALGEMDGQHAIADLLEAHRYTDGLSFVERGTPTNDTREGEAGTAPGNRPTAFELACGDARRSPGPESDAARAARLLGLEDPSTEDAADVFDDVAGAGTTHDAAAEAMNTALWPATWGYYLPHMLAPASWTDRVQPRPDFLAWLESYRRHFVAYVRAGGPIPTFRVGAQPYGVLPVTDLDTWDRIANYETTVDSDLPEQAETFTYERLPARNAEADLVSRLRAVRGVWADAVAAVPSIESPDDPEPVVANLLAMAGTTFGYRLRSLLGGEVMTDLIGSSDAVSNAVSTASADVAANLRKHVPNAEAPRVGELLAWWSAPEVRAALVADDLDAYLRTLRSEPHGALRTGPPGSGLSLEEVGNLFVWILLVLFDADDDSLLEILLYVALTEEYRLARVRLGHHYDDFMGVEENDDWSNTVWALFPEPETYDDGDHTLWRALDEPVTDELAKHPEIDAETSYGDLLRELPEIDAPFVALVNAFASLESADEALAERLLRETLDLSSHRFDAWATSIATRRLDGMRAASGEGLYVGAYGYVENLKREPGTRSAGYIQAPSVGQATTAAILRSGYEAGRGDELAIDLSAERVRDAHALIDAVRAGQPLGELLGYRFERRLRERYQSFDLERYIPALRSLAPLVEGKIDRQGMTASDRAAEHDAVDGVAIAEAHRDGSIPWGQSAGSHETTLPSSNTDDNTFDEYEAIRRELESLEDSLDAVSDVLTAESVHQLVSGNPERAGGSLDALSRGEAPPDLAVTETPRTGTATTHRLLVLLDPEGSTWGPSDAPRATAEPALNDWAGTLLGDPSQVVCRAAFQLRPTAVASDAATEDGDGTGDDGDTGETDVDDVTAAAEWRVTTVRVSDLDLCPLDLVYLVEGDAEAWASELEERIDYRIRRERSDVDPAGEVRISFVPPAEWPNPAALGVDPETDIGFGPFLEAVRGVREMVTSARAADARDVALPGEAGEVGLLKNPLVERANSLESDLTDSVSAMDDLTAAFGAPEDAAAADAESEYDRLRALVEVLESVPDALMKRVQDRLDALDIRAVSEDLAKLASVADGDAVAFARDKGGDVVVDPRRPTLSGLSATRPGTVVQLVAQIGQTNHRFQTKVGRDGVFEAKLPEDAADELDRGDRFQVTATVNGTTTSVIVRTDRHRGETMFVGRALREAADLAATIDSLDRSMIGVEDALNVLDDAVIRRAADRIAVTEWPTADAPTRLDVLLTVGAATLPEFAGADGWDELRPVLLAVTDEHISREVLHELKRRNLPRDSSRLAGFIDGFADDVDDGLATLRDAVTAATERPDRAFAIGGCETLRAALLLAANHGVHGSVPVSATGATTDDIENLLRQADSVAEECDERLEAADAVPVNAAGQRERIEALFEDAFEVVPPFAASNPGELDSALDADHEATLLGDDPLAAETWFQRVSRIRDVPRDLGQALIYGESLGDLSPADGSRFHVAQLPYKETDTWVGRPEAWDGDPPTGTLSLVAHASGEQSADRLVGLFVDEFVETVPSDTETTGVSVHYDKPGNRAPQSMLLAVPPTDEDWSFRTLADLVTESVELAKLRTVDPEALSDTGHLLPGAMLATNESSGVLPDTASVDADELGPQWWYGDGGGDS